MGSCSKAIYPDESEAESEAKNVELDITATKLRFGDLALQHAAAPGTERSTCDFSTRSRVLCTVLSLSLLRTLRTRRLLARVTSDVEL